MHILKLQLHNFRSYSELTFSPGKSVTVLIGSNGAGKTNILESIHLCATAKSHRTNTDKDMIKAGELSSAAYCKVQKKNTSAEVGLRLYGDAKKKKKIFVNGKIVPKIGELMGNINCVMFSPEDLEIIKGGPQNRRRYLDILISQCSSIYFYSLQTYNNILKQRNAYLRSNYNHIDEAIINIWDEQLAAACVPIVEMRRSFVEKIRKYSGSNYQHISSNKYEAFDIFLYSSLSESSNPSETLLSQLKKSRLDDIRRGTTFYGPHRDDISMIINSVPMKGFASQGQIRTATLALKLSEIEILDKLNDELPILLLDDVFDELDSFRQLRLIEKIQNAQTFITCTDLSAKLSGFADSIIRISEGKLNTVK